MRAFKTFILAIALHGALSLFAAPHTALPIEVTQPDGSRLTVCGCVNCGITAL